MNKDLWGEGPWQTEPDRLQWTDTATGLVCLILRSNSSGALCGYVGIQPGHRYHGHHYDDLDLGVHRGLTYAAACDGDTAHGICHAPAPGEADDLYWLGFDCAHCYDLLPMQTALTPPELRSGGDVYRDIAYVRGECERLAAQLA